MTNDENCSATGLVDFGYGEVLVRCTKIGKHKRHVCVVFLQNGRGRKAGDAQRKELNAKT